MFAIAQTFTQPVNRIESQCDRNVRPFMGTVPLALARRLQSRMPPISAPSTVERDVDTMQVKARMHL